MLRVLRFTKGLNPFIFNPFTVKTSRPKFTPENQEFEEIKQMYRELANDIEDGDEDSILNILKGSNGERKYEMSEEEKQKEQTADRIKLTHKNLGEFLSSLSTEEMLLKSKELQQNFKEKRSFATYREDINSYYQDYSLFDKNMIKLRRSEESTIGNVSNQKNLEFLNDLENDVKTKVDFNDSYSFLYRDPAGHGVTPQQQGFQTVLKQEKLKESDQLNETWKRAAQIDPTLDEYEKQLSWNNHSTHLFEMDAQESDEENYTPRLSMRARLEIFDLYNQGWSVRDLSVRYAALPQRIKAVIHQWRIFFDEIYPNMSLKELQGILSFEKEYEKIYEVVDYGIDMEDMVNVEFGEVTTIFRKANRNIDVAKLEPKEQERLKNLFKKKVSKLQDIVTEKYVGEGNKGYFIKSWHLYKTRSKPRMNTLFQRIIRDSDKPYKFPRNVQKRLALGPRRASTGYGIV